MNNTKYLDKFQDFNKNNPKFQILHLNINSILNHLNEVDLILNTKKFDLVFFCETKLDDTFPNSFYKNDYYYKIRLDRSRHGGGLIVFIKNSLLLTKSVLLEKMELIYFQARICGQTYNFIYTYRAPNLKEQLFLEKLEDFMHSLNLNEPLFIAGDLNMDYDADSNSNICKFIDNNDLINFVNKPTRISKKFYKKSNTFKQSSTLIDLLLHNGDKVDSTNVIDCPFSDHHFLLAKLDIQKSSNLLKQFECRNLSAKNIEKINTLIDEIDLKKIRIIENINDKWLFVKNEITKIIDNVAPTRKISIKNFNQFPWYDDDLLRLKHQKNSAYKRFNRTNSSQDKEIYEYFNNSFKSYNDEKLIEYFKDKSMSDFKNSKKFWQFYSTKINIKSDNSNLNPIGHVKLNNGKTSENKTELCNIFNGFFTSISTSSDCSITESTQFIDDQLNFRIQDESMDF